MVSLPYQYNLEGIWYNKEIFEESGSKSPQTFDELLDASDDARRRRLHAAARRPAPPAGR